MKQVTRLFLVMLSTILVRSAVAQDVLTQHNDNGRTGWNQNETVLTTNNVNSSTFGLAYTLNVDDKIYAQPLVVNGVNIPGVGIKNVVYVATVNNTIYAYDADVARAPYWTVNYTNTPLAGSRPPHAQDPQGQNNDIHPSLCGGYYYDFLGSFGLVGTPVIDKNAGIMYFVTKVVNGTPDNHTWDPNVALDEYSYPSTQYHQFLHAVDITTGAERSGSPVEITATAPGTGDGNVGNIITFDSRRQFNRSALALSNGIIYIAFAAHCDFNPSHGWLLGYRASNLHQQLVYNTTPNDGRGGIWMSGFGPAIDDQGNIYFTTGNSLNEDNGQNHSGGTKLYNVYNSDPTVAANRGESVIKLTPNTLDSTATGLTLSSYFTPYDYLYLNDADLDFPIQTMVVPNTNMLITGCKDDSLYVMSRTSLGGFNSQKNNVLQTKYVGSTQAAMHSSFAYFGGTTPLFYQFSENTQLQSYPVLANSLGSATQNTALSGPTGSSGAYLSVSSNGQDPASAILWASHPNNGCDANSGICKIVLRALKATDVTKELWNSTQNATDNIGFFSKMVCPTVANGKVYESTGSNYVAVYGIKDNTTCVTNVDQGKTATASSNNGNTPDKAVDGSQSTRWTSASGGDQWLMVDMGSRYDFCRALINWQNTNAQNFNIEVSENGTTWTNVESIVGNTSTTTDFYGSFSGRYVRMHGLTSSGTYSINEFQLFGQTASSCAAPANLAVPTSGTNSATITWDPVFGVSQYIVQYRNSAIASWITRTVATNSITISQLACKTSYNITVQAVCGAAQSSVSSGSFETLACTGDCGHLPTRIANADIGDVGLGGSSCYLAGIYTITGSGADIGGTGDQFQYTWFQGPGDNAAAAQLLSQDQVTTVNKAGVMIRDSLSNTSRFAYFASVSQGKSVVFQYRSVPGGPTTSVTVANNVSLPYWLKIEKYGTQFAPFTSPDGTTWTQAGNVVDLGFGNDASNSPKYGMAVTSVSNTVLSATQFGSFSHDPSNNPLPIKLASFTAKNVDDDHILISWATSMEDNVDHFTVQKSTDGSLYQDLISIPSLGNSETLQNYSVTDQNPIEGLNYYRLLETDSDSKTFLSPVVTVQFGKIAQPELRPNPATDYTYVVSNGSTILEVTVYDMLGKQVRRQLNTDNSSSVKVYTGNLGAGVYVVRIKTPNKNYRQKLIKE